MNSNCLDWATKLDDASSDYHTTYKKPIGLSLYQLFYSKACHFHVEIEHKTVWALKKLTFEWSNVEK